MYSSDDNLQSNVEPYVPEGRQRYYRQRNVKHKDEAWVRWEYSPEEWALFEKIDWIPIRFAFWVMTTCWAASLIVGILSLIVLSFDTDGVLLFEAAFFSTVVGWCVFLPLMLQRLFPYIEARKRHKARQQHPHTVTFSREGVWEAGTFFPIHKHLAADLKKVTLTFEPPVLHFHRMTWPSGKNWSASAIDSTLHVPLPYGKKDDASLLLERFQVEVIQERAQREQLWKNPPEPR